MTKERIARFEAAWQHPIPHKPGGRAAHLLNQAEHSRLDLLFMVGGNHLETMPDRDHTQRALQNVGLRVHQYIVLNTSTLLGAKEAVLVLPAQPEWQIPCLIGLALEPHRQAVFCKKSDLEELGAFCEAEDAVAVESPLEIRLGKESLATASRTPGHDEELVAGLL